MTVRHAVERRDQAVANAPAKPNLGETAKQAIDQQQAMLDALLPPEVSRDRFKAMTLTALKDTPKLLECFATRDGAVSFTLAMAQAAMVGLEVNTPLEEAWLLPRNVKDRQANVWRTEAELSIGYRGFLKLARRTGNVRAALAEVVYSEDEFDWWRDLDGDHLIHRPAKGDRGELAFAYCIVRFFRGDPAFRVLSKAEVHDRRASSESYKRDVKNSTTWSPWSQPHKVDAMWRKSAVRAIFPYLDHSVEVQAILDSDEQRLRYDPDRQAIDVASEPATPAGFEISPADLPELPTPAADGGPPDGGANPMATPPQLRKVNTLLTRKLGVSGDARFGPITEILDLDRPVTSTKDLTHDEAERLCAVLVDRPDHQAVIEPDAPPPPTEEPGS